MTVFIHSEGAEIVAEIERAAFAVADTLHYGAEMLDVATARHEERRFFAEREYRWVAGVLSDEIASFKAESFERLATDDRYGEQFGAC